MTSLPANPANLADLPGAARVTRLPAGWLIVGRVAAFSAVVLSVLLQWINNDFFPPQISVSQYGLGPRGWVFTCWAATSALAVVVLGAAMPAHPVVVSYLLGLGCAGLLIMGIVRTDAGGLQQSWHAQLHTAGAIVALLLLPFAMAFALSWTTLWWRRVVWSLVGISAVALVMVLLSAAGVATPSMDAPHSWAFWQAVAVTLDMAILGTFGLASFSRRRADLPRRPRTP